jgi:hypothetical protein
MINPFGSQLLNVITYLPLVGGLMVLVLFRREHKWAVARFATWVAALDLLVSLVLWIDWWKAPEGPYGFRFVQQLPWIDAIGVRYLVGVDGISMLMVLLTTVLGFVAILSSWTSIQHRVKEYYAFLLFLQTGMIGVFVSLDLFLFYILHVSGLGADAAGHPRALSLPRQRDRPVHLRRAPAAHDGHVERLVRSAVLGLAGILSRLRHQGADVPVPHVAARRPHRSPHGGLGHPGGGTAENG